MITSITLSDFRNHSHTRIKVGDAKNIIITGPNGAGKTAIIESVSMLGGDRGMRGSAMNEIARFDGNGAFSAFAELYDDTEISVYFQSGDNNRRAKIDGDNSPLSALGARLRIIWISPKEDRLFLDASADRRAFFDRLVSNFDPSHAGRVGRLTKLLSERAFALKSDKNKHWLDALDIQIAAVSVAIAAARIQYAGEVNYFLHDFAVSVSGITEQMIMDANATDAERDYLIYLEQNRELVNDKMLLQTPNKSDFGMHNNKLNLPVRITSTGQQKTALLDLILAHAKLIHAKTNMQPIILLDEAAAHLDDLARDKLFDDLGQANAQVWATGLDANIFKNIKHAAFVSCENGKINNILIAE